MSVSAHEAGPELVLSERRGAVQVLTLNRPDRLNAWTNDLEDRYFDLLDEAERDSAVRAIVVTGAGRGFCAGADMEMLQDAADSSYHSAAEATRQRPKTYPLTLRKPLIAAINGPAAGLGLVQALLCDLRFCAPDAKLTTSFARRGLIAEYGAAWILPRLVGQSAAMDLLLSARVVLGDEAQRLGMVDRLVPRESVLDAAVAYAQDLADHCSPASMATIKAQVQRDLGRPFVDAAADADRLMFASLDAVDVHEGVSSYLERRSPAFPALPTREQTWISN